MKAMILHQHAPAEQAPLRLEERAVPVPGEGELLVRVHACGVCHTDLHTVEGDIHPPRLPIVPGHEVVGTVEAAGPGVKRFCKGDRVGIAWLRGTCGKCEFCCSERENLCEECRFTGFHADGGYAEYAVIHEDFAYPIPEGLSDREAAPLLCAGIIGYRALMRSGVRPGETLGIHGFGASAHITIQVARRWGCEVFVWSRTEEHRALARKLGAAWCGRSGETPPHPTDGSILFAPSGKLVPAALRHLKRGGTLALAGIHVSPIPEMEYEPCLFYEKTLTSVTANARSDGRELLKLAADIPIRSETQPFPLAEANAALVALKQGRISGAAVLIV